jgi:protease-4
MRTRVFVIWMIAGFVFLSAAFGYATYKSVSVVLADFEGDMEEGDESEGDIAILQVRGVIMNADEMLRDLRRIEENESLKALVVRIDSPGGAVGPSEEVYEALMRLRSGKKLKIVCSLGDIAASGGYYIASACEKIISNAGTLTGSIGVIMPLLNAQGLYTWAKIEPMTIKAGRYKDLGSDQRPMRNDERELLEGMLTRIHQTFKRHVQLGRGDKLKPEILEEYGDGRVFTGEQAAELGFVDAIGGEEIAINHAAQLAGIKGKPEVLRRNKRSSRWRDVFDFESDEEAATPLQTAVEQVIGRLAPPALQLPPGRAYLMPYHFFQNPAGSARSR